MVLLCCLTCCEVLCPISRSLEGPALQKRRSSSVEHLYHHLQCSAGLTRWFHISQTPARVRTSHLSGEDRGLTDKLCGSACATRSCF
ncbi:hypothetical protein KC19_12G105500 [Ceratodon purpureus]|uniref:Secreted protein n=1 Tax=Ceratodon purpureus TaxID=3225 RepID=A0A8T0G9E8_CERPU|nr:hypothetical protein KC19_12G105500 [Ceratodon purpureus]